MTHAWDRAANLLGAVTVALGDRLPGSVDDAAIVTLRWNDGVSVDGLARIAGLSQPGGVRLVDRLERDGLVRRAPGHDGRTRSLHLTARGRRRAEALLADRAGVLRDAVDALGADGAAAVEDALATVLAALTNDPATGDRICRLCDEDACGVPDRCPVERALEAS